MLSAYEEKYFVKKSRLARWLLPKRFVAITLFGKVYCRYSVVSEKLATHELVHVVQQKRLGHLKFLWRYLKCHLKHGYCNNPFEIEARYYAESAENRAWFLKTIAKEIL